MLDMLKQTQRSEVVVGWYHSHPSFGCWLSSVDINTQVCWWYYINSNRLSSSIRSVWQLLSTLFNPSGARSSLTPSASSTPSPQWAATSHVRQQPSLGISTSPLSRLCTRDSTNTTIRSILTTRLMNWRRRCCLTCISRSGIRGWSWKIRRRLQSIVLITSKRWLSGRRSGLRGLRSRPRRRRSNLLLKTLVRLIPKGISGKQLSRLLTRTFWVCLVAWSQPNHSEPLRVSTTYIDKHKHYQWSINVWLFFIALFCLIK